jgi:hypothetical protein
MTTSCVDDARQADLRGISPRVGLREVSCHAEEVEVG